jgi:glycosyltransferase involved in cell wall biosynthesis
MTASTIFLPICRSPTVPRVSICIPAYNTERYLPATLASVRQQTFTDWELILVEDGSRDATEQIVRDFATQGPQSVSYLRHESNQGLPTTRNTGFEKAEGELIAILDADDLWRPDHLQRSLTTLEATGADLVFSGCQLFDSDTGASLEQRVAPAGAMEDFPRSLHDGRIVIQPSTVVVRRAVIKSAGGFDPTFPICNDLEFWFRVAKSGARVAYTGAITCDYRKHAGALSRKAAELVAEVAQIHAAHRDWPAVPAEQRRRELWRHHLSAARMLARGHPWRAFRLISRGLAFRLS